MYQIYYLKVYSPSGLESKEIKFNTLYDLFDFIRRKDYPGFDKYVITKRSCYVKSKV